MFKALMLAAAAALCAALPAHAGGSSADTWGGADKKMHFGISATLGFAAINQWPNEPLKAFGWALLPGLLKELSDAQKGGSGFSGKDLAADALGAAVGVGLGSWLIVRQGGQTVLLFRKEL